MKNLFLVSILLTTALPALSAEITKFDCHLVNKPTDAISFSISDLNTDESNFVKLDPDDEYSQIFTTTSNGDIVKRLKSSLEGQGGDFTKKSDRIEFFGDDAGIDFSTLVLFKNSGYQKGYVRWDFAGEQGYSPINCEIK